MESVTIKTEDPRQICRLCLSEESLNNVFEEEDVHQMISDYLSITISVEDRLSQFLCEICQIRLTEFHQFRINCQEAQIVQQSMLKDRDIAVEEANLESHTQEPRQDDPYYGLPEIKKSPLHLESSSNELPDGTTQEFKREIYTNDDYQEEENSQTLSLESFVDIGNVKVEANTDSDFELTAQSSSDLEQTVQEKANVTKNKSYDCPTCHKILPCRKAFWYHKKREHDAPNYSCCGIRFVFQSSYTQHLQSKQHAERLNPTPVPDDPRKPYKCEMCHKVFRIPCRLREHKQAVHGPKLYACPVCDLKFGDRSSIRKHFKTHRENGDKLLLEQILKSVPKKVQLPEVDMNSSVRPFKCDLCPRAFKEKSIMTNHRKRVHGPKIHSCGLCDFKSYSRFNLERHERTHDQESAKAICSKEDK